jgi:4-amino-4-deoxy-L-arabinose transferase-like glycosyltransferase
LTEYRVKAGETALLYIKSDRTRLLALLIGTIFALALFSKEMCVTLPFLLLFLSWSRKTLRKDVRSLLALFTILALFAILRTAIIGNPMSPDAKQLATFSPKTLFNFAPYLVAGQDSSGTIMRFSDFASFSGHPQTVRIDFPHTVKLFQVEPVVNRGK